MTTAVLDMANLPPDDGKIEAIINQLSSDELLGLLNQGRRMVEEADGRNQSVSERFLRTGMLIARRLRSMRETKSEAKSASKSGAKPAPKAVSLDDLLPGLG